MRQRITLSSPIGRDIEVMATREISYFEISPYSYKKIPKDMGYRFVARHPLTGEMNPVLVTRKFK